MSNIKKQFIQALRPHDVELAEDLHRRMPEVKTVGELNGFMHGILAQHQHCTLDLRSQLQPTEDFNEWFGSFTHYVLPEVSATRLPTCTDKAASPAYQCTSKSL